MTFRRCRFPSRALAALCIPLPFAANPLVAQVPVPVGAGSYASEVPASEYFEDAYYGLRAAQVEPVSATPAIFNTLHLDPSLAGKPFPTNQWWTVLLIDNRSGLPPGSNWYYVVTGVNGDGESANSNQASAQISLASLDQWRFTQFGTNDPNDPVGGNLATPQNDGVPNLIKYALGLHPHQPASGGLPSAASVGASFNFTFTRMKIATDIVYHVDASASPASWTEIWSSSGVPYGGGAAPSEQVVVADVVPMTAAPDGRRFMRLRVTQSL
ncbi:MAG: hypothetical protein H7X97_03980 [Opitutaceae bacterium]|nr:hypothetical protein [Verrucomicrobiales bacterium]